MGLYRWTYFTHRGDNGRRVVRQAIDDFAIPQTTEVFAVPAPGAGEYRYPVALVGDRLLVADYTSDHMNRLCSWVELGSGTVTPLDEWTFVPGGAAERDQVVGYAALRALSLQVDATTVLVGAENTMYVIDTTTWTEVNRFYTVRYGWETSYVKTTDGAVYAVQSDLDSPVLDGTVKLYEVRGPIDVRTTPHGVPGDLPLAGRFGVYYDAYGHYTRDGMLSAAGTVVGKTVEWAAHFGMGYAALEKLFGAESRLYGARGFNSADFLPFDGYEFVAVTPYEYPEKTASSGAYTVRATSTDVFYGGALDWYAIAYAQGLDVAFSSASTAQGAGTMYFSLQVPFWTNKVRAAERE